MQFPYLMFIDPTVDYGPALSVDYDPLLVAVSYLIASLGSYAALMIGEHLRLSSGARYARWWLLPGAVAMGFGVWAMHFVGMLAARLPVPVGYDVLVTGVSLLPAALAGGVCLAVYSRDDASPHRVVPAGITMGAGIGAMHYIGMAAMRMSADMRYDMERFLLSIAVAVLLACAALYVMFWARKGRSTDGWIVPGMSALIMGLAITAMHYTGMWAVYFFPTGAEREISGIDTDTLAATVAVVAVAIIGLTIAASLVSRRFERLRIEARASQLQLTTTVENIPAGFVLFDRDRKVDLWNRVFEGMQPELKSVLKPGARYDQLFPTRSENEGERRLEDGRWIKIKESVTDTGKLAVLWSDITQLKEAEERLASFLENAPDAIVIINQEGRITFCNAQAVHLLGCTRKEIVGRQFETLVPKELRRACEDHRARCSKNPELRATAMELPLLRGDGAPVPVEIGLSPLQVAGEDLVACAIRDVSARKQAEEALRESEEKYRGIVETAHEGICILGFNNNIIYANGRMAEMLGYSTQEMQGRPILEFMNEEHHEEARRRRARRHAGLIDRYDFSLKHKDGSEVRTTITASPRKAKDDSVVGSLLMISDISERERIAQQMLRRQKIEAVGQLTGGVAHEFNNLLMVILGNLELIDESSRNDEALNGAVREALDAGRRGAELIKQLLSFSQKQQLAPEITDLNETVTRLEALLQTAVGGTNTLVVKRGGGLWLTKVDRGALESALLHLIVNARDAMPNGGALTIETSNAVLDEDYAAQRLDVTPGDYVLLRVSDTGGGIHKDVLEKVFEPFFSSKEVGKGTGLGLSMVYGFVKQSQGHINMYSEEGYGTTVKIYLPRSEAAAPDLAATSAPQLHAPSAASRILLVEDDEGIRRVASRILRGLGYQVFEAETGAQALSMLEKYQDIDLLFTDVVMPGGMSGPELARHARQRNEDLKVLYSSGYTETAIFKAGISRERGRVLNKPYRREELAKTVREILEQ